MNITKIEKQDKNIVQLSLEIEAEHAAQEYNKACKRLGNNVSIPGFRRGKAPRAVIEKYVGIDKIKRDALDKILPSVFADAISENDFDIAIEPVVESYTFELGSAVSVKVKIELKPEVKLPNYRGMTLDVVKFEMPKNAIELELNALAEKYATLEPVIDKPVGKNDLVVIDFSGSINGELIRGGQGKNITLDITNNNFIKGFSEQLVGKNLGEESVIKVTFPEDYYDPNLANKEAEFVVKINEIKAKKMPEMTDEFAKKVTTHQTMAALKKDIQDYLAKTEERENDMRLHQAILEKVVQESTVEIPDSMINREARVLMSEVQERFKSQGISWEDVLDRQGHERIWNNLRTEAEKRVKTSLVVSALIKAEGVEVTQEDYLERVGELASYHNTDKQNVLKHLQSNINTAHFLSQQVISNKVLNKVAECVEINYIEESEEKK